MTREYGSLRKCFPVAENEVKKGVQRTERAYTPMGVEELAKRNHLRDTSEVIVLEMTVGN